MSNVASKNVAAKVLEMIRSVGEIPKTGFNERFKYKFTKETDVADALRAACLKVGLVLIPSVHDVIKDTLKTSSGSDQYRASLMLRITLIDPISGESIEMDFPGEAMDTQDKAIPKAITSAYKYALLKLAMNGGGEEDDPEHDSNEQTDKSGGKAQQKPVHQGATYRKPDEETKRPTGSDKQTQVGNTGTTAKPATGGSSAPATNVEDRPMSTQTEPKQPAEDSSVDVAVAEVIGTLTAVLPAMKGKPAQITIKPSDGGPVMTTHFDPKQLMVPAVLQFMNQKTKVQLNLDVTQEPPFVMAIKPA